MRVYVSVPALVFAALVCVGVYEAGYHAGRSPHPTPPPVTHAPELVELCSETGVFRVFVVPGTGVAAAADPGCGTGP